MNIDRIAREMVDVEPSVDLEARIRARLRARFDDVRPARTAAWWSWRVAAPLGAIASLALAFIVVQGPGLGVQSSVGTSQVAQVSSSPVPQVTSSPVPNIPTSQVERVGVSKVASKFSAEELAWMERRIPALDSVNSLGVEHLRVDSIQPEPLAITPLTMTPVATESGGIERRNDR